MKTEPILKIGNCEIIILEGLPDGDIIHSGADVIVNSAGTRGRMGKSGDKESIASTIVKEGGESIRKSLQDHKPLIPGDVVITGAGDLPKPTKNIYHAVVVEWGARRRVTQATIWRVVSRCMELAQLTNMTSIAFPSLGTYSGGAERFETYSTMSAACLDSLQSSSSLRSIRFCFPSLDSAAIFRSAFGQHQFIWQTRGLIHDASTERFKLANILEKLLPKMLGESVNDKKLEEINKKLDKLAQDPSPKEIIRVFTQINTQGGAYIAGGVSTGGGDFVGRDQTITAEDLRLSEKSE